MSDDRRDVLWLALASEVSGHRLDRRDPAALGEALLALRQEGAPLDDPAERGFCRLSYLADRAASVLAHAGSVKVW